RRPKRTQDAALARGCVAAHVWKFPQAGRIVSGNYDFVRSGVWIWAVAVDVRAAASSHHRRIFSEPGDDSLVDRDAAVAAVERNAVVPAQFRARRAARVIHARNVSRRRAANAAVAPAAAERDGCGVTRKEVR